ncbi:MAG: PH domain-containing protein [Pirellulales bacterium]
MQTPLDPKSITRPAPELFTYYLIIAILTLPAVIIVLPALWFRYITLRYTFDEEGVSMRWGIFFQRETVLTYRRIQDIHVTRDLLQRWLGLATVSIQTAAGSAMPEMKLEGILQAEPLRDFLYERMRGARGVAALSDANTSSSVAVHATSTVGSSQEDSAQLLTEIRDNLQKLLQQRGAS